jgi:hypothetical protein
MTMRYREFIKKIYFDSIAKQRLFPTLQLFNEHYDDNFGDFNWIDYLSGKELTSELTMDLICTQVIVFGRAPEKVPDLLHFYASRNKIKPDKELMSLSGNAWLVLFQALDYGKKRAENKKRTS